MAEIHRVVAQDAGDEQRLMDKAKAAREAEIAQRPIDEMEAAKAHARRHVQRTGVFRSSDGSGNGPRHLTTLRGEAIAPLPANQVRVGGMVTSRAAAINAGLIDESGALTDKGRAVGGSEGPGRTTATRQEQQRQQLSPGDRIREIAHEREQKARAQLAAVASTAPEPQRQAPREQTPRPQESPAVTPRDQSNEGVADGSEADSNEMIEQAFAEGRHTELVDAGAALIDGMKTSPAYQSALDAYVRERSLPSAETYETIGAELGMDGESAAEAVNMIAGAVRAEAYQAVKPILVTDAEADVFVRWLRQPANRDLTQRALTLHLRAGNTIGWVNAARAYLAREVW